MNYNKYILAFICISVFLSLCLLPSYICHAQSAKIDSLQKVLLTAKEDTNKVNALNALSEQLWKKGNYDTALIYANNALALANSLSFGEGRGEAGWKKGIAKAYNNIGIIYQEQGNYPEALKEHFASLKLKEELLEQAKRSGNPAALRESKQGIAASHNNIGLIYYEQGNYPEALKEYFASLKLREEIAYKQGIAMSHNNIGIIYKEQGNYPEALKEYFAALKLREEIGDKQGIAYSHNNIGDIYMEQGNYHQALKEHFASLKIRE